MRKFIVSFIVLVMIATMMAACGNANIDETLPVVT